MQWPGRLEVVDRTPLVVLDGAHNPAAAAAVAEYMQAFRRVNPESRVILVLGMMRDKDHLGFANFPGTGRPGRPDTSRSFTLGHGR